MALGPRRVVARIDIFNSCEKRPHRTAIARWLMPVYTSDAPYRLVPGDIIYPPDALHPQVMIDAPTRASPFEMQMMLAGAQP